MSSRGAAARFEPDEIGRDLIEVKQIVGHGHFLKWIDAEFGMSDWTARQFANAADVFGAKSEIISDLPPTVLYALAAPSTPDEVRTEIVDRAERGEKVAAADVRELKAKLADIHRTPRLTMRDAAQDQLVATTHCREGKRAVHSISGRGRVYTLAWDGRRRSSVPGNRWLPWDCWGPSTRLQDSILRF